VRVITPPSEQTKAECCRVECKAHLWPRGAGPCMTWRKGTRQPSSQLLAHSVVKGKYRQFLSNDLLGRQVLESGYFQSCFALSSVNAKAN
jgi:hypothetical protein